MLKKTIITLASIGLLAGAALPAFAQTSSTTPVTTGSSTAATSKIMCVGNAVNARETSIDAAMTTYTASLNTAYSTRAAALKQAYTLTTTAAVKAAVKTAWSTFSTSAKSARMTWQTSRNTAWATYRTAAVACKAPAGTGDGVDSGLEASGN